LDKITKNEPSIKYDNKTGTFNPLNYKNLMEQKEQNRKKRELAIKEAQKKYNDLIIKEGEIYKDNEDKKIDFESITKILEDLKRDLKFKKEDLKKYNLYAKNSGVIENIFHKTGEYIKKGEAILKIVDNSNLKLEVSVSKRFRDLIKTNQIKDVMIDGNIYKGRVSFISLVLDLQSKTFKVKILLHNNKQKLYAGLFAEVILVEKESKERLVISKNDIKNDNKGKYLFRVSQNHAEKVYVEILKEFDDRYAVASKILNKNDLIINGNIFVKDGQLVKVIAK